MVRDILNHLLEADDEDFKEVYAPADEEYSLQQIRAAAPEFFSRKNGRAFGTRKVYKYKGNYVVLQNVKKVPGHGMFSLPEIRRTFAIYQWKRTQDTPQGDLFFVAHADDLEEAKAMIKYQDFRPRLARLRQELGLGEAEEFKELFHPEVHEIQVQGKEWWRRGAGGTYHTARIWVNGELVHVLPENGGSGDSYLYRAFSWLSDNGYIAMDRNEAPTSYCRRMGINLIKGSIEVRRERDLDRPMTEAEHGEFKEIYYEPWRFEVVPETQGPEPWKVVIYHYDHSVGSHYAAQRDMAASFGQRAVDACLKLDAVHPYQESRWSYNAIWNWLKAHGIEL